MTSLNEKPSLTALMEIAQIINTIQDSQQLLEKILEIALDTLSAERGFMLLNSDKTPEGFEIKSSRNLTDSQASVLAQLSTSVVQEVQKNAEPVLSFEVQNDPRYGAGGKYRRAENSIHRLRPPDIENPPDWRYLTRQPDQAQ